MFEWTGLGCDVCGFGTIEDIDDFNPYYPCPDCGEIMLIAELTEEVEQEKDKD